MEPWQTLSQLLRSREYAIAYRAAQGGDDYALKQVSMAWFDQLPFAHRAFLNEYGLKVYGHWVNTGQPLQQYEIAIRRAQRLPTDTLPVSEQVMKKRNGY